MWLTTGGALSCGSRLVGGLWPPCLQGDSFAHRTMWWLSITGHRLSQESMDGEVRRSPPARQGLPAVPHRSTTCGSPPPRGSAGSLLPQAQRLRAGLSSRGARWGDARREGRAPTLAAAFAVP